MGRLFEDIKSFYFIFQSIRAVCRCLPLVKQTRRIVHTRKRSEIACKSNYECPKRLNAVPARARRSRVRRAIKINFKTMFPPFSSVDILSLSLDNGLKSMFCWTRHAKVDWLVDVSVWMVWGGIMTNCRPNMCNKAQMERWKIDMKFQCRTIKVSYVGPTGGGGIC